LAAKYPKTNVSDIVNDALRFWLSDEREEKRFSAVVRRLDRMSRLGELHSQKLAVQNEALALFVRYFLTVIPQVSEEKREAAKAQGAIRFEGYLKALREVLSEGSSGLLVSLQDILVEESDFFTADELDRLHEPLPADVPTEEATQEPKTEGDHDGS
jgi:hypothetical protein